MTAEHWAEFAPDLVLVTTSEAPTLVEKANARALIPDGFRVEFFDFDRETFWLNKPEEDAERLRVLVESVRAEQ